MTMNTFEFTATHMKHYREGELIATVSMEHLDDYRQFVPDTPKAPVDDQSQAG